MRIAILGWGSLLWEPGADFGNSIELPWSPDGPTLPIEFSRISTSRGGALTLVIDPKNGSSTTVAWCLTKRAQLKDAVVDLRRREGTNMANIRSFRLDEQPAGPTAVEKAILDWATDKKLDAVTWTALQSNFETKTGQVFSIAQAIAHVKSLSVDGKVKAVEYVRKAPDFIHTPLRSALLREPWFFEKTVVPQEA